jgi:hypothetical protein
MTGERTRKGIKKERNERKERCEERRKKYVNEENLAVNKEGKQ